MLRNEFSKRRTRFQMLENSVNYTSEISHQSAHASSFGGEAKAYHSFNNISHYKAQTYESSYRGWLILGKTSPFSFKFAELYNCTVYNLIGLYGNFNDLLFEYINVIECKSEDFVKKFNSPSMKANNILFISSSITRLSSDVSWITKENVLSTSLIEYVTKCENIERYTIQSIKCGTKNKLCTYKYRSASHIINYSFLFVISS